MLRHLLRLQPPAIDQENPFSTETMFPACPKLKKWSQIKYMTMTKMLYIVRHNSHERLPKTNPCPVSFPPCYLPFSQIISGVHYLVSFLPAPLDASPMRTGTCLVGCSSHNMRTCLAHNRRLESIFGTNE